MDNVFAVLAKYKKPEDYWTAALLCVLEALWDQGEGSVERAACIAFLVKLGGLSFSAAEEIRFDTQRSYKGTRDRDSSRIDAQISSSDKCVWIEVKDDALLRKGQMDKYKRQLAELPYPEANKKLVLLRHFYGDWREADKADIRKYWIEVYDWLEDVRAEAKLSDDTGSGYLVKGFLDYLRSKGVRIVSKISEDALHSGLIEITDFIMMLRQVVEKSGLAVKKDKYSSEENYVGVIFDLNLKDNRGRKDFIGYGLEKGRYHVGIYAEDPSVLWMEMDPHDVKTAYHRLEEEPRWETTRDKKNKIDWISLSAPLGSVFSSSDKREQIDKLSVVFRSMFEELKGGQIPRRGRR